MSDPLSNLWHRLKANNPRFQAADESDVQTHINHALVTTLLFGTLGALGLFVGSLVFVRELTFDLARGYSWGLVVGLVFYTVREINQRLTFAETLFGDVYGMRWIEIPWSPRFDWKYRPWDGVGDVLVQTWIVSSVITGSALVFFLLAGSVALLYFVFRPLPSKGTE